MKESGGMEAVICENIRMRCLDMALRFYLAKVRDGKLTPGNVINLAGDFYEFVRGESLHKSE